MGVALQCCVNLLGVKRGPRKFHLVVWRLRVLTLMGAAYVMIYVLWCKTENVLLVCMPRVATLMGATYLTVWVRLVDQEFGFACLPRVLTLLGATYITICFSFVNQESPLGVFVFVYESVCLLPFPK